MKRAEEEERRKEHVKKEEENGTCEEEEKKVKRHVWLKMKRCDIYQCTFLGPITFNVFCKISYIAYNFFSQLYSLTKQHVKFYVN